MRKRKHHAGEKPTSKENEATRAAITHRAQQPSHIDPSPTLLARDLGRDLERAEFLARDGLDLGARFDDFDLRASEARRAQKMSEVS